MTEPSGGAVGHEAGEGGPATEPSGGPEQAQRPGPEAGEGGPATGKETLAGVLGAARAVLGPAGRVAFRFFHALLRLTWRLVRAAARTAGAFPAGRAWWS